MKKQVMSLLENTDIQCDILDNTYDVSTMLLYVDKHNIATEPQVYWPNASDKNHMLSTYYDMLGSMLLCLLY